MHREATAVEAANKTFTMSDRIQSRHSVPLQQTFYVIMILMNFSLTLLKIPHAS